MAAEKSRRCRQKKAEKRAKRCKATSVPAAAAAAAVPATTNVVATPTATNVAATTAATADDASPIASRTRHGSSCSPAAVASAAPSPSPAHAPAGQFVTNSAPPGGFKRRPRGSSDKIRKEVESIEGVRDVPCAAPGCNHVGFTWAIAKKNGKLGESDTPFDVPRGTDGHPLWHSLWHWSMMNTNNNYNNFLRLVRTHFVYEITMKNCGVHKVHCPGILVERAQKALNQAEDPSTSRSAYRPLWEALELTKGDPLPSSKV